MHRPTPPQRHSLRFCKAFFEILDAPGTERALRLAGAQILVESPAAAGDSAGSDRWLAWTEPELPGGGPRATFLLRVRGARMVLEGPTPETVGRGWRALQPLLSPHAEPRVAAGDDLHRFVGRARRHSGDRPETWDPEYERRVLAEFYAAFCSRWAEQPQARLQGLTPRQAAGMPELRPALEELIARLERVQQERQQRGMAAIDVESLRAELFATGTP